MLVKHKTDVEHLMRPIKGFVSYTLAHTADGGISVTVCETKAGTDEGANLAREWVAKNAAHTDVGPAAVAEGSRHLSPEIDIAIHSRGKGVQGDWRPFLDPTNFLLTDPMRL